MLKMVNIIAIFLFLIFASNCGGSDSTIEENSDVISGDTQNQTDASSNELISKLPEDISVKTTLSKETIKVGEEISVSCEIITEDENFKDLPTEILVQGTNNYEISGKNVKFNEAGTFFVLCKISNTNVIDENPPQITVLPAKITKIKTMLEKNKIEAGESTAVSCFIVENDKEFEANLKIKTSPEEGLKVESSTITGEKSGKYKVICYDEDSGVSDDNPPILTVIPSEPAKVVTKLEKSEIKAGESTGYSCEVYDEFGNTITDAETDLSASEDLNVENGKISGTKAGEYEVKCVVKGYEDIEEQSETLVILPLGAEKLVLYLKPEKKVYEPEKKYTLAYIGLDKFDNEISDIEIENLTYQPAEDIEVVGDLEFKFKKEGFYKFEANIKGSPEIFATLEVPVDIHPPTIEIYYPERGVTLTGNSSIEVKGKIYDNLSDEVKLFINNTLVETDENGEFTYNYSADAGLNILTIKGMDKWELTKTTYRSFLYSTKYYSIDPVNEVVTPVDNALILYLDRQFFIDEDNPDNDATISSIMNLFLANLDLNSLITNPVSQQKVLTCTYDMYVENITYDSPDAKIYPVEGGLHLYAELYNFYADIEANGVSGVCIPKNITGYATASKVIIISDMFVYADENGKLVVDTKNTTVNLEDFEIKFDGISGALLNLLVSLFKDQIKGLIENEAEKQIQQQVTKMMEGLFGENGFSQNFEIKPFIGNGDPTVLSINLFFQDVNFTEDGGTMVASGSVTSEKNIDKDPLGSIGRDGCLTGNQPIFSPQMQSVVEAGVFDDFLNEFIFSYWWNGALNFDLTADDFNGLDLSQYQIKNLTLITDPYLPPIINSCNSDNQRLIEIGDFYAHATFEFATLPVDIEMFLYMRMPVDMEVINEDGVTKIALKIEGFQDFYSEIVSINDQWKGKESTFENLINNVLKSKIEEQLQNQNLSFELPTIPFSSLMDGLPEDKGLSFDIETIDYQDGYTIITGKTSVKNITPEEQTGQQTP